MMKRDNTPSNPFPGLRAFTPEESHLFFGRAESTTKVVNRLVDNRFAAVIGASGSGKSSLVFSGVIPALIEENEKGKKTWSYLIFRPELNPVDNLAAQLSELSAGPGFTYLPMAGVAASLHNRSEGIIDIVNKMRKNLRQQILIVVDQFEEIFRYSPASSRGVMGDQATDFIDLMVDAAKQSGQGLYILLTLRSEYVSECSRFHSLTNLLNLGSYLLPQLSRETLTTVIEEPIRVSGASIDRSVVRNIISDLGDRPGQLPVLQHTLMRMWNHWSRGDDHQRALNYADYEAVGKIRGAISQHAGQALELLDERHRYVCSRLFQSITMRTDDGKEIRKPERIQTISLLTGCGEDEIIKVAEVFRDSEFSFLTPSPAVALTSDTVLDLSHESIIRSWSSLRAWMDEEDVAKRLYLRLARAAAVHEEGKGRLWTPPDLMMAIRWRDEYNPTLSWADRLDPAFERTMLFLKSSEEEYRMTEEHREKSRAKKIKQSRLFAGIFGILVLITLIALGTVMSLRARAERQKSVALRQKDEALVHNMELKDSLLALSDILSSAIGRADASGAAAVDALRKSESAGRRAREAERVAEESERLKQEAINAAAAERTRKMIKVAKSLAVRSLNHTDNKDLQVLLAWQGYIFNDRYAGNKNDADIYAALYDVGKRYGNRYYAEFNTEGVVITAMASSESGKLFYTADQSGRILQWRADEPGKGYTVVWSGEKMIRTMTLNHDETWLACGTTSSEIVMIPLVTNTLGFQLQGPSGQIAALAFSSGSEHLYSATLDGMVTEWDLDTRASKNLSIVKGGLTAMDLSPDNHLLAGMTADGRVLVWQVGPRTEPVTIEFGERKVTSLRFVPWDDRLVIADETGMIALWNTSERKMTEQIVGHEKAVTHISFNVNNKQMITACNEGVIKLWTMADLKEAPVIISDGGRGILDVGVTDGGRAFIAASSGRLTERPSHVDYMTTGLCDKVTRNLTQEEWAAYVGRDINYETTCENKSYQIKVSEIRSGQ